MSQPNNEGYISTFLQKDYVDFAVYRVYQRLPHVLDSLGQTQRKIIHVLEKLPSVKKVKTAEVYSFVYSQTKYLHGDASVFTVVENMARSCSNNLNILTEEGAFGYRTNKAAASPRYTSTRFSKGARVLFNPIDSAILETQEFEGTIIEPKFLLPVLPPSLLNGYSAIAVGFASKFMPRNPLDVINETVNALQYKKKYKDDIAKWQQYKVTELVPAFPMFTGKIVKDIEHEDPSAWYLSGVVKKVSLNRIEVTDIPPESNREAYIKKLKRLIDKGVIRSFTEGCVKNKISFKIKTTPETGKLSEEELLSTLGLIDKSVENFTFLNPKGDENNTILKFDTAGCYLKYFINLRQEYYENRRKYLMDSILEEINILTTKIRFISDVNEERIIITKRKKSDLDIDLESMEYPKKDSSYDYLLGMKMYSLTEENIARFEKLISDKREELEILKNTTSEDMHISELKELKKAIKKEMDVKGLSGGL
jgi:DNA topoisomerase-2